MRYLVTAGEMREAEAAAVLRGTSLAELMERAGSAVADETARLACEGRILVLAGAGNNGGDGWVAARRLLEAGRDVVVLTAGDPAGLPSPALEAAATAIAAGVAWEPAAAGRAAELAREAGAVIDALLGTGAHGAPRAPYAAIIEAIGAARCIVIAVDVPSGVDADTGAVAGASVDADVTVTFGAPKRGCVLRPGGAYAGELVVADIGLAAAGSSGDPEVWEAGEYTALLPRPAWDANKSSRGRVLVVGGAPGLTGAVCLAGSAALRSGAGYVTVAVPAPSLPVVEVKLTAPVKVALPASESGVLRDDAVDAVCEAATRADAVVLGPGLGRDDDTVRAARELVRRLEVPLVLDADGLYALGGDLDLVARRAAPTVITPHEGEAARLLASTPERVRADRFAAARALSVGGAVAVLKGPSTLIAGSGRMIVNRSGGPALATLGTGDVLAGVVGALLSAGLASLDAAVVGTYVQGRSGDVAARELTELCCTAEDVVAYLPYSVGGLLAACVTTNREGPGHE